MKLPNPDDIRVARVLQESAVKPSSAAGAKTRSPRRPDEPFYLVVLGVTLPDVPDSVRESAADR